MEKIVKAGVIGCGNISSAYMKTAGAFSFFEVAACADIDHSRASRRAAEFGIPRACSVDELLEMPEISIVLNLTPPAAHVPVAIEALKKGKCVYNEKPLALDLNQGREILRTSSERKLLAGCAPDTFMGGGLQTCRKLVDEGAIGKPVGACAFMMSRGVESWHPNPEFYYKPGGGPLFDMGPYYLTALINLLGPVKRVAGMSRRTFEERVITNPQEYGRRIAVETPTHINGLLEFENGALVMLCMSFDVPGHSLPPIEIYGEEASMSVPDPNGFRGPVRLFEPKEKKWREVPLTHGRTGNWRCIGAADMARALVSGRPHRASAEMACHVLEVMHSVLEAPAEGRYIDMESSCRRPAPLPAGLPDEELD